MGRDAPPKRPPSPMRRWILTALVLAAATVLLLMALDAILSARSPS